MPFTSVSAKNLTIGALLRRSADHVDGSFEIETNRFGVPSVALQQGTVLKLIPPDGISVSALAYRTQMSKQRMGYLISGMKRAGLVNVTANPIDRRSIRVVRSSVGEELVTALTLAAERQLKIAIALVGKKRVSQLHAILECLCDALNAITRPPQTHSKGEISQDSTRALF